LGTSFTCVDSVMGPFIDIAGTTTMLTAFDKKGITYLAATNAGWLPYFADEGICFMHYSANRVMGSLGWIRTYLMISLPF